MTLSTGQAHYWNSNGTTPYLFKPLPKISETKDLEGAKMTIHDETLNLITDTHSDRELISFWFPLEMGLKKIGSRECTKY